MGLLDLGRHLSDEFRRRGNAQDHTDILAVYLVELHADGIVENLLGDDQGQQLYGIRRRERLRQQAVLERIERHRGQKGAALRVDLTRLGRIGVVVILDQPIVSGNLFDEILAFQNVVPEALAPNGSRK